MDSTSTNRFPPPIKSGEFLQMILETQKRLDSLLPPILYKVVDYLPVVSGPEKEKLFIVFFEHGETLTIWESPPFTGRKVVLFHPDNLEDFLKACRGKYRPEEWYPRVEKEGE